MTLAKDVRLSRLGYHGGITMASWLLHRITGLGMLFFVGLHVLSNFSMQQQFGWQLGIKYNHFYESPYFQTFLYLGVIFHVLNGTRIILMDLWPRLLERQRKITRWQWGIYAAIFVVFIGILIRNTLIGR